MTCKPLGNAYFSNCRRGMACACALPYAPNSSSPSAVNTIRFTGGAPWVTGEVDLRSSQSCAPAQGLDGGGPAWVGRKDRIRLPSQWRFMHGLHNSRELCDR